MLSFAYLREKGEFYHRDDVIQYHITITLAKQWKQSTSALCSVHFSRINRFNMLFLNYSRKKQDEMHGHRGTCRTQQLNPKFDAKNKIHPRLAVTEPEF
jgi:hypothetical protein